MIETVRPRLRTGRVKGVIARPTTTPAPGVLVLHEIKGVDKPQRRMANARRPRRWSPRYRAPIAGTASRGRIADAQAEVRMISYSVA